MIDFAEGKYRSKHCAECREDPERMKKAMEYDGWPDWKKNVQQLVCATCSKRLRWWWFAKLPLTKDEERKLMEKPIRPGRAF